MVLSEFDFELPSGQIAQEPLPVRSDSRLLELSRKTGRVRHRRFSELPELLQAGDLLIVNDARVSPARLLGHKKKSGGRAELLVVRPAQSTLQAEEALHLPLNASDWICLGQASKGFSVGAELVFSEGLEAEVLESLGDGHYRVRFHSMRAEGLAAALALAGRVPLPPYIEREPTFEDGNRYQTVYAKSLGSVAAPTAGLHFSSELLETLKRGGVARASLTLDIGPGTFLPVREESIERHRMHSEAYVIPADTVQRVEETKARGGRVVAVGTTVVRALEAATDADTGALRSGRGETNLFIRPGYVFRQIDALVTNFHLPRSTLLMLVSAFGGRAPVLAAYREAVEQGYRFFSYGDAMWIGDFL